MAADFSAFAREFVEYIRTDRDLKVLSRLFGQSRAHPRFHPHGTVTSRVLVSDPYLQQLRRKFRGVIAPDKGFSLSYLDYRQFEPGILAGLSEDAALIEAYNSKDLYISLASELFGSDLPTSARDLCKRMFLGFCYGMSQEHIAKVVAGPTASANEEAMMLERVNSFFSKYEGLAEFKKTIERHLLEQGFVETGFGNRRYRTAEGRLTSNEKRWAISQVIQGNASLVFKEAVRRLGAKFGASAIMLPMHDAVLMQFEVGTGREQASQASAIMRATFKERFPRIFPRVAIERFALQDSRPPVVAAV